MRDQIHKMFTIQFDYTAISNNVKSNFSMENYYNKIINIQASSYFKRLRVILFHNKVFIQFVNYRKYVEYNHP